MNTQQILWTETVGNKFAKNLEPMMLTNFGLKAKQCSKPTGRISLNDMHKVKREGQWYEVTYDKQYVITYIIKKVVSALNIPSLDYLIRLMLDVWYEYRNQSSEALVECADIKRLLNELKSFNPSEVDEF